ncbi:MAG: hypothetical protein KIH67_002985 [Candidatus Moranbacteria bacterium]|nr:hypothetical protein [Candidatus Moranbacteria bacterium]
MAWFRANKYKEKSLSKFFLISVSAGGLLLLVGVSLVKIYGDSFFSLNQDQNKEQMTVNPDWFSVSTSEKYGQYLTDKEGYTLYMLDESRCDAECMKDWQLYQEIQSVEAGEDSVVETREGMIMPIALSFSPITWKDKSLYKYRGDEKAGDINGMEALFSDLVKPE